MLLTAIAAGALYNQAALLLFFQKQRLHTLDFQKDPLPAKTFGKLWPHRVNSLERFALLKESFNGMEADVVFETDAKQFLVYHPPFTGHILPLAALLQETVRWKKRLWLDMRGVDSSNYRDAFTALTNLNNSTGFRPYVIVELYDIVAANFFADQGYSTAINIAPQILKTKDESLALRAKLHASIQYVSQEDLYLEPLKAYFPSHKIITWSPSFRNYIYLQHFQQLINDTQVAVVLVNIKSRYRY